jgi:hypothetical protein
VYGLPGRDVDTEALMILLRYGFNLVKIGKQHASIQIPQRVAETVVSAMGVRPNPYSRSAQRSFTLL